jgi:phosphatidylserine decarboxylase
MSNDTKQFVEQIAAEADATADQPMPATSTRPNKSVTVATRMSPEDLHAIHAPATALDVPISALVRGWVLARLSARPSP